MEKRIVSKFDASVAAGDLPAMALCSRIMAAFDRGEISLMQVTGLDRNICRTFGIEADPLELKQGFEVSGCTRDFLLPYRRSERLEAVRAVNLVSLTDCQI